MFLDLCCLQVIGYGTIVTRVWESYGQIVKVVSIL